MKRIRIGLLGCGTVGGGFVRLVTQERERLRARYGVDLEIARILVRDLDKQRPGVARELLTTSALEVIDGDCDLIVEAIGGVHTAGSFVRRRSEEHTSELQSRLHLVCRLLLEKKKRAP